MMAQVSENKSLNSVFQDIFDTDGAEIYLKPMAEYIEIGKPVNFYTILESARKKNETEIRKWLTVWHENHTAFEKCAAGNTRLEKVVPTSKELSTAADFAIQAMDGFAGIKNMNAADKAAIQKTMGDMPENRAGTVIAIMPSIKKLIDLMPEK